MGSIGGLDVAYGASTQIVRTNVLAVAVDAGGSNVGVSASAAKAAHSVMSQALPATLAPDFTCFFAAATPLKSGYSTAGYAALFEQDNDNDGVFDSVSIENGGVLRSLADVPLARNSATPGDDDLTTSDFSVNSQNGLAFDATTASLGAANIQGSLSIEGVLSVGAVTLTNDSTAAVDDLFTDGGDNDDSGEHVYASDLSSGVMKRTYDNFTAKFGGAGASGHIVGGGGGSAYTLDLSGLVGKLDLGAVADGSAVNTATATTEFNATTEATNLDGLMAAVASGGMAGAAAIISVYSLARKN